MPSFKHRSYKKEFLDGEHIPFDDIKQNMQELEFINRRLGGHDVTLDGIVALIHNKNFFNSHFNIVEIGCGGGDNLMAIKKWCKNINLPVSLSGVDINAECINYAKNKKENAGITFIHSDYRNVTFNEKPDIIFSSLFCHHFTDEELISMLKWKKNNSQIGFFINDLHRHPLAYYSIKFLTGIFSSSYLVKHDAPISVLRGFKRSDWQKLIASAGITNYQLQKKWAFRWLLTSTTYE